MKTGPVPFRSLNIKTVKADFFCRTYQIVLVPPLCCFQYNDENGVYFGNRWCQGLSCLEIFPLYYFIETSLNSERGGIPHNIHNLSLLSIATPSSIYFIFCLVLGLLLCSQILVLGLLLCSQTEEYGNSSLQEKKK